MRGFANLFLLDALGGDFVAGGFLRGDVSVAELAMAEELPERVALLEVPLVAEAGALAERQRVALIVLQIRSCDPRLLALRRGLLRQPGLPGRRRVRSPLRPAPVPPAIRLCSPRAWLLRSILYNDCASGAAAPHLTQLPLQTRAHQIHSLTRFALSRRPTVTNSHLARPRRSPAIPPPRRHRRPHARRRGKNLHI